METTGQSSARERPPRTGQGLDPSILQTSARDLLYILFKRKWSLILITLATFLCGAFWIFIIRDEAYQVSAKVMVRIGHEQASTASVAGPPIMITGERMQDVNTEADILGSTDLIARVVDHFGLDKPRPKDPAPERLLPRIKYYAREWVADLRKWRDEQMIRLGLRERLSPREQTIHAFQEALVVKAERNSNVITATLFLPLRKDSGKLLNTLLEFYQAFRLELYRDDGTKEFFRSQTGSVAATLKTAEEELRTFEVTANISAIDKQKELLLSEIAALERAEKEAGLELREVLERVKRVQVEMRSDDPNFASLGAFLPNSFPDQLLQQLAALQKEREVLRMTELDSSARIRNNRNQFRVVLGLVATYLQSTAADRQSVYDARQRQLAARQAELRAIQDRQTTWSALRRKVKIFEDNYLINRKRLDETTASVAMEQRKIGNVVVIQHAVDAVAPLGMSKTRLLGLAFLLALIAALSWVAIAEFFDHGVYTADALERRLGIRVLAEVPAGAVSPWSQAARYAPGD